VVEGGICIARVLDWRTKRRCWRYIKWNGKQFLTICRIVLLFKIPHDHTEQNVFNVTGKDSKYPKWGERVL
jgi:hypothetical protein